MSDDRAPTVYEWVCDYCKTQFTEGVSEWIVWEIDLEADRQEGWHEPIDGQSPFVRHVLTLYLKEAGRHKRMMMTIAPLPMNGPWAHRRLEKLRLYIRSMARMIRKAAKALTKGR